MNRVYAKLLEKLKKSVSVVTISDRQKRADAPAICISALWSGKDKSQTVFIQRRRLPAHLGKSSDAVRILIDKKRSRLAHANELVH